MIKKVLAARGADGDGLSSRSIARWLDKYKAEHRAEYELMRDPDGWRSKYRIAVGKADEGIRHINDEVQIDATASDVDAVVVNGRRCYIVGAIEVYTRRAIALLIEGGESSYALRRLIASCYLTWVGSASSRWIAAPRKRRSRRYA